VWSLSSKSIARHLKDEKGIKNENVTFVWFPWIVKCTTLG
jgi:hypothetical protein